LEGLRLWSYHDGHEVWAAFGPDGVLLQALVLRKDKANKSCSCGRLAAVTRTQEALLTFIFHMNSLAEVVEVPHNLRYLLQSRGSKNKAAN
jgi:hypothetical protein